MTHAQQVVQNSPKDIILYVDDESSNLDSFNIIFRKYYDVKTATSAEAGIKIINEEKVKLVISDQRMPKTSGVELLEQIANDFPEITRIIITAYSDIEAIISAINKGQVFRYITKPWDQVELKKTIDQALEIFHLKVENKWLIKSLKKTNNQLDELVYRSSHDMRAPLASLLGLTNLAKKEEDKARLAEYLNLQEKSIIKLDNLLKDIIEFTKNKHFKISNEKIDLENVIVSCIEAHEYFINSKSIKQKFIINQTEEFYSDELRLEILFNNLLSNAIRYHNFNQESPFILIKVTVENSKAIILVQDNGIGIRDDLKLKIFDMFYKGSDYIGGGSGLGLFIVRETVELMQGEIELKTEEGKGSSFIITLPNSKQEIAK